MIKNIIFDLGGVVVAWRPDYIFQTFPGNPVLVEQIRHSPFFVDTWSAFDRGTITKEELVEQAVKITSCPKEDCEAFISYIKSTLADLPETIALIRELSEKGYRLFCLSNMSVDFYDYLKGREVFRYFEGKVISAKEQLIKPDPAIYTLILQRYRLKPEETLFIDDLESNIQAAREQGIHTVHFTGDPKAYNEIRGRLTMSSNDDKA